MGKSRRMAGFLAGTCLMVVSAGVTHAEVRSLSLINVHTNQSATIVFKRNGRYDPAALKQLNYILRDWRIERPTNTEAAVEKETRRGAGRVWAVMRVAPR